MAQMGLPTALRAFTAEQNRDAYKVRAPMGKALQLHERARPIPCLTSAPCVPPPRRSGAQRRVLMR